MLRPLFPYYGSKWRDAYRYGKPEGVVIEPFAGSAGYSIYWGVSAVHLYDVDPIIVGLWNYLIRTPASEIMALPDLEVGQSVDDFLIPQEAKWLIGFWLNRGSSQPKKSRTAFSARTDKGQLIWGPRARERIASQLQYIRGWTAEQRDFIAIPNREVTWFIDPPYVNKGRYYRFSTVDYPILAAWSRSRLGFVFVCEQEGATWLPFVPLATIKSTKGTSAEVVYRQKLSFANAAP